MPSRAIGASRSTESTMSRLSVPVKHWRGHYGNVRRQFAIWQIVFLFPFDRQGHVLPVRCIRPALGYPHARKKRLQRCAAVWIHLLQLSEGLLKILHIDAKLPLFAVAGLESDRRSRNTGLREQSSSLKQNGTDLGDRNGGVHAELRVRRAR